MLRLIKQHLFWSVLLATAGLLVISLLVVKFTKNHVSYVKPKRGPIIEAIYGLGKVKPDKFYEVKLAIIKQVKTIHIREGSTVKKGDALIEMAGDLVFYAPFDGVVTAISFTACGFLPERSQADLIFSWTEDKLFLMISSLLLMFSTV